MFSKILIANRGEIACRVIRSARKMGIATVAVYSDADRTALHAAMADEAVRIGPAAAAESYLDIEAILEACRSTGAEAVHPGYGFLSERAAFAEALAAADIAFIGPGIRAIEAMGDKIESKKFADAAKVSTVPGHLGIIESAEAAVGIADEIGYPVMIKASAGGGGKGMRIAWSRDEVADGYSRARSEAASSFGDDRVFIEKFITDPRHIEIQVLADRHGNTIHLGERECSIQRRNQKIIEEAPSPFLDAETRAAMGAQAVALARAVDYQSAGTVEFIVDADRKFYFLEMNTRLQVEHPVTELVTGIDLVEEMIRIAAGETLRFDQDAIRLDGWAVESRIYAEDPYRGFLPSTGRLVTYRPPEQGAADGVTIRNDTGVVEGSEISMFYDPMIAKLVTHADDRPAAIQAMSEALDAFLIDGIEHNIPFLMAVMQHPRWRAGDLSTAFIDEEYPEGFHGGTLAAGNRIVLASAALAIELTLRDRLDRLPGRLRPVPGPLRSQWTARIDDQAVDIDLVNGAPGGDLVLDLLIDGEPVHVESDWLPGDRLWSGTVNGEALNVQVRRAPPDLVLASGGISARVRVMSRRIAELDALMPVKQPADTSRLLLCPMPGLVVSINVVEGQEVKAGETLAVIEAMKMENVLRAERDATVAKVGATEGDTLSVDAVIMEFV